MLREYCLLPKQCFQTVSRRLRTLDASETTKGRNVEVSGVAGAHKIIF